MNLFEGLMESLNEVIAYEQSKKTWPTEIDTLHSIVCPHCHVSHYQVLHETTTAIAWTPIYKNGVLQNKNPNVTTTYCRCLYCGEEFNYKH